MENGEQTEKKHGVEDRSHNLLTDKLINQIYK